MWPLEAIHHQNSPARVRQWSTVSYPVCIKTDSDTRRIIPWLAHSPDRHDRCRKRIGTFAEWDHTILKAVLQAHGPFLAARDTEGTLICWVPGWVPET